MSSTTTGLSQLMAIYYDKVFLDRAEAELRYDWGAQKRNIPLNSGKTVYFNRFSTLAAATTALTEATNPSSVDMTSTIVSATIADYGTYTTVGSLFSLTSIDENLKEHTETLGYNAGFTIDTLILATLSSGATAQVVGGKALTAVAATDVITASEIKKAVRTLKRNKARPFENGLYRGIIPVSAVYDLRGDSTWLSAQIYTDSTLVKNGAVGNLHGVEFVETNNEGATVSTTTTCYMTFIFGKNAYGMINLASQPDRFIYVKQPGDQDTSNPLNMYSTVGWKCHFVAKVLNADWIINIETGVTA